MSKSCEGLAENLPQAIKELTMSIRVLIVDDQDLLRIGVRMALEDEGGFTVVGEAEDAHTAVGMVEKLQPDVVLMDVEFRTMSGIEATAIITEETTAKVIMLSAYSNLEYVRKSLQAGATGYVVKGTGTCEQLFAAFDLVMKGEMYVSPDVKKRLPSDHRSRGSMIKPWERADLTKMECEVLELIWRGFGTREIAYRTYATQSTVKTHIKKKLGLENSTELILFAAGRDPASIKKGPSRP